MTLADAHARVPLIAAFPHAPAGDHAFLAHLADACLPFTPSIALEEPDGLTLDISGCAHLFGGETGLATRLQAALAAEGVSRLAAAIAPTPDMARALARFGKAPLTIAHGEEEVRALPLAALEAPGADALALRRAGLKSIGDVADRPSVLFSARFTQAFTTKLIRVLGQEDRRIAPRRSPPPCTLDHICPEPVMLDGHVLAIIEALAGKAARVLEERGEGGRVFRAMFFRTDGAVRTIAVETSRPVRDPSVVARLYRDRLDALADPLDPGFGYDLIRLHVALAEPYGQPQTSLNARDQRQEEVAALLDRLAIRFGAERIVTLAPADTHTPERAQTARPATGSQRATAAPWPADAANEPPRPVYLFAPAQPVEVDAAPEDGDPMSMRWRRVRHEIARSEGPERIAGVWWAHTSHAGTRDYYRVETGQGRRFWIFRSDRAGVEGRPRASTQDQAAGDAPSAARWFLHGVFP